MSAEETWKIILTEDLGTGGGTGSAGGQTTFGTDASGQDSTTKTTIANVGKMAAGLVGITGTIAFVFQMIKRSKIFSTFMDAFLTILSAVVDILLIPLIPILGPALKLLMKLIPVAYDASKAMAEWLKDPWQAMKDIFSGIAGFIENIGKFFGGGTLGTIADAVGNMLRNVGDKKLISAAQNLYRGLEIYIKERYG